MRSSGALSLVDLRGLVDDVYVGSASSCSSVSPQKNSISSSSSTEQLLEQGRSITQAAIEAAARLRLRPS